MYFGYIVDVENIRKSFWRFKEGEKGKNFDKKVNSLTIYKIGGTRRRVVVVVVVVPLFFVHYFCSNDSQQQRKINELLFPFSMNFPQFCSASVLLSSICHPNSWNKWKINNFSSQKFTAALIRLPIRSAVFPYQLVFFFFQL